MSHVSFKLAAVISATVTDRDEATIDSASSQIVSHLNVSASRVIIEVSTNRECAFLVQYFFAFKSRPGNDVGHDIVVDCDVSRRLDADTNRPEPEEDIVLDEYVRRCLDVEAPSVAIVDG